MAEKKVRIWFVLFNVHRLAANTLEGNDLNIFFSALPALQSYLQALVYAQK